MTVLLGYIPTPAGERALDAAIREADRRTTRLIVVNIVPPDGRSDPRTADEGDFAWAEERIRSASVPFEMRRVTADSPTTVLLDLVESEQPELLVIGLRRREDIGRHLLGHATQSILLASACPVLIV